MLSWKKDNNKKYEYFLENLKILLIILENNKGYHSNFYQETSCQFDLKQAASHDDTDYIFAQSVRYIFIKKKKKLRKAHNV